jgi:uncharacterized membrane-anchored protein
MSVTQLTVVLTVLLGLISAPLAAARPCPQEPEAPQPGAPAEAPEPSAAGEAEPDDARSLADMLAKYQPEPGTSKLGTVAEVRLADGWLFLPEANGRRFLTDLGNRPGASILGVAIPPDFDESHAFAVYSYVDDGHVADDEDPDYDALLHEMQEAAAEQSKERKQAGMGGVRLLGWAEPPHYDRTEHKLYWAERLQFEGSDGETLNYNVRVLGRTGHLVVNGVGDIDQIALVAAQNQHLLQVTDFVGGQRYQDFDPAYDKVAAYGIGALVAGKVALKVGLFAKFGLLLKGLIKPILVGLALLGAFLAKLFGRKKRETPPAAPAA